MKKKGLLLLIPVLFVVYIIFIAPILPHQTRPIYIFEQIKDIDPSWSFEEIDSYICEKINIEKSQEGIQDRVFLEYIYPCGNKVQVRANYTPDGRLIYITIDDFFTPEHSTKKYGEETRVNYERNFFSDRYELLGGKQEYTYYQSDKLLIRHYIKAFEDEIGIYKYEVESRISILNPEFYYYDAEKVEITTIVPWEDIMKEMGW